jgi:hypothetical protein
MFKRWVVRIWLRLVWACDRLFQPWRFDLSLFKPDERMLAQFVFHIGCLSFRDANIFCLGEETQGFLAPNAFGADALFSSIHVILLCKYSSVP